MIISFKKNTFKEAIQIVARFTERKTNTLPTLSGICIIAGDEGIKISATNLETSITLYIEGIIQKTGVVVIPAEILKNITTSFSDEGTITFEHIGEIVIVSSGGAKSTIKTLSFDDFPIISKQESTTSFTLAGSLIKELLGTVISCASISTIRPELSSILFSFEGGKLKAVATDSFRLAEKQLSISGTIPVCSALIPAKNASDIIQTLPQSDISISLSEHQGTFSWGKNSITTRLIQATYPDYIQIIPKKFITEIIVSKKEFEEAVRSTIVFSDSFQKIRLTFDVKKKQLILSARNPEIGESTHPLSGAISGESIELSFNYKYIYSALSLTESETISLSSGGIGRPLIIKGVGDTTFLYLVMPMNQ